MLLSSRFSDLIRETTWRATCTSVRAAVAATE
jgi:hypothetical protein